MKSVLFASLVYVAHQYSVQVQTCCKTQQKRCAAKNTPLLALYKALYKSSFTYFFFHFVSANRFSNEFSPFLRYLSVVSINIVNI